MGEVRLMNKKLTLFVFVDAFGWEVYKNYGFLGDLLPYARRLETTFGFSSAADPSILTGRYPDEHTHWSCFYYSPQTSPFKCMKLVSFLPRCIFDRWRFRHWLSKILAKMLGWTGYFEMYSVPFSVLPYFDYAEKRDYFVPGGIMRTDTIFDYCVKKGIKYHCSNWRKSEPEVLSDIREQIELEQMEFAYLYLPKLDAVMHRYGTVAPQVEDKIRWLEQQVRQITELAKQHYEQVSLYAISDHGMANVSGSVDLIAKIEATGLKFGTDYVAMYDSTMARFWFMNEKSKDAIQSVLQGVKEGYIVSYEELEKMHVFFDDHRFGDTIFLMNAGILIVPSFMGLTSIPGMHGYHPHDKDSYSFILGASPLGEDINSITDIRKVMEQELD